MFPHSAGGEQHTRRRPREQRGTLYTEASRENRCSRATRAHLASRPIILFPVKVIWPGGGCITEPLVSGNSDRAKVAMSYLFGLKKRLKKKIKCPSIHTTGRLPSVSSSFPPECRHAQSLCWHVLCLTQTQLAGMWPMVGRRREGLPNTNRAEKRES